MADHRPKQNVSQQGYVPTGNAAPDHEPDCNCHICQPYTEWLGAPDHEQAERPSYSDFEHEDHPLDAWAEALNRHIVALAAQLAEARENLEFTEQLRERLGAIRPLNDAERQMLYRQEDVIEEARCLSNTAGVINTTRKLDAALKRYDEAREVALAAHPPTEQSEPSDRKTSLSSGASEEVRTP